MRRIRNFVGLLVFTLAILGYTQQPVSAIGCGSRVYDQQGVMCHWEIWCNYGYGDFSCNAWCGNVYTSIGNYCASQGGSLGYFTCMEGDGYECGYPNYFVYGDFSCENSYFGDCP